MWCRYDVGITDGVTSMDNFLLRFFPKVAAQAMSGSSTSTDAFCTYSNQNLQAFTLSLFLAAAFTGLLGSFSTRCAAQLRLSEELVTGSTVVSLGLIEEDRINLGLFCTMKHSYRCSGFHVTERVDCCAFRRYGRKSTMLLGGICFLIGAVLTSAAYELPQLVIGRVVLGFGVGA